MLLKKLIEKNNQLLIEGNFSAYIKNLYELGAFLEDAFIQEAKDQERETFADETDKKKRFFLYAANFAIFTLVSEKSLTTSVWNLKSFLTAWEDPALRQHHDKILRQSIKLKGDIDKYFRRRIHAALIVEVIRLRLEVSILKEKEFSNINFNWNCELNTELIQCLTDCINLLQSETPPDHINQTFDKAAKAIATFKPTAEKFLHGFSIFIGLLAALACGLATGGFLFLLVSGFGAPLWLAALSGLLMFTASTYANFKLFFEHSSRFLRTLAKIGSITEFIDSDGQRQQLSVKIKCLLALGAILSVGVGLSSASLTLLFGMALIATIFPSLGATLAGILISALVLGMTIGLSLIIFKAWVYLVNLFRAKCSTWADFSKWLLTQLKTTKKLTVTQRLGYLVQAAFMGFAIFGLFFLCFAGIPSLVPAFTPMGSWIVGMVVFLGELPSIITVSSFCSSFMQWFSRSATNATTEIEAFATVDKPSLLSRISHAVLLVANAAGRSIQVFDGKLISIFAAVACFFSALAGTLSKSDNHEASSRNKANHANKALLIQEGYKIAESTNSVASNNGRRNSSGSSCSEFFSSAASSAVSSDSVNEPRSSAGNSR